MAEEIPPKMTRESREPHEEVTQITVQTGEKQPTPEKVTADSRVSPDQVNETEEKTGEKEPTPKKETEEPSKPREKPRAKLFMDQLLVVGTKKPPATLEEIPEYLYRPGSKQY